MSEEDILFIQNVSNLERLNEKYFQPNRAEFEFSSIRQISATSPQTIEADERIATPVKELVINDYVRINRIYCMMLWAYWEARFENTRGKLELLELSYIRNCLAHHDGDMQSYAKKRESQHAFLMKTGLPKGYIQNNILIFEQNHLLEFTDTIKRMFKETTGQEFVVI